MRFEEYLAENFNLENAKKHLQDAKKHNVGTTEHHDAMSLHHSQMFWYHRHKGNTSDSQKHYHQMNHHIDQVKRLKK